MAEFKEENFPGNSIRKNPERKPVKRVVTGAVRQRKEPILDKIFGGETARSVGSYVIWDVLVPAAKSTISDIITTSIELLFYGEKGSSSRSGRIKRDRDRSYISYNSLYDGRSRSTRRDPIKRRDRHDFDDIVFETRGDAEHVLTTLIELIDQYELATVEDFYEAVGLPSEYTDGKYGWESLGNVAIKPIRGGWFLTLPKPRPIE
jgi:hypothetical protein